MSIDLVHLTPWASLAGGALIGLAGAILWLGNGRVAGMSGIAAGVVRPARGDTLWRVVFLAGLFCGGLVLRVIAPDAYGLPLDRALHVTALGGLLVGVGTRMGGGCTSGHGVCGLSRLSPRSTMATFVFIATGMATAVLFSRVGGGG